MDTVVDKIASLIQAFDAFIVTSEIGWLKFQLMRLAVGDSFKGIIELFPGVVPGAGEQGASIKSLQNKIMKLTLELAGKVLAA